MYLKFSSFDLNIQVSCSLQLVSAVCGLYYAVLYKWIPKRLHNGVFFFMVEDTSLKRDQHECWWFINKLSYSVHWSALQRIHFPGTHGLPYLLAFSLLFVIWYFLFHMKINEFVHSLLRKIDQLYLYTINTLLAMQFMIRL